MKLSELLDLNEFGRMVIEGYIRIQSHPEFPNLKIANYSEKASYERVWNRSTRLCRGLIFDEGTDEILAIPFPKFHNHSEPEAQSFDTESLVDVYDKVDGSCGIFYVRPDGKPAIATRGSFASDQAIHATHVLQSRHAEEAATFAGMVKITPVFEIVYPENRIVLNYDFDDLVLLGFVDWNNGDIWSGSATGIFGGFWEGRRAEAIATGVTMTQALSLPNRENAEGVVIRSRGWHQSYWDVQTQVKVKQEDYIALHKIVTNLSERAVWEIGYAGDVQGFISVLPDEFHDWATKVHADLKAALERRQSLLNAEHYCLVRDRLPVGYTRKDFALTIKGHPQMGWLFALEDGRDITDKLWAELKPAAQDKLGVEV